MFKLRDYKKSAEILRNLKTYCNMEQEVSMAKGCNKLWEQCGKREKEQTKGEYTCKDLFVDSEEVANYCSDKIESIDGKMIVGKDSIKKGDLVMSAVGMSAKSREGIANQLHERLERMPLSTTLMLT
jgi:hypothetical protein